MIEVDDPAVGPIELPGPPMRFGDRPTRADVTAHHPPPRLGEHNASVRAWLDEREQSD